MSDHVQCSFYGQHECVSVHWHLPINEVLQLHSHLMNDHGLEILRLRQWTINYDWIACETFDSLVEYTMNVWALFQSRRHFIDNNHQKIINDALKQDFNGYCLCSLPLLRPCNEQRIKEKIVSDKNGVIYSSVFSFVRRGSIQQGEFHDVDDRAISIDLSHKRKWISSSNLI